MMSELLGEREESTGQTGRPYRSDRSGQTDKKKLMVYYLGSKLMTLISLIVVN